MLMPCSCPAHVLLMLMPCSCSCPAHAHALLMLMLMPCSCRAHTRAHTMLMPCSCSYHAHALLMLRCCDRCSCMSEPMWRYVAQLTVIDHLGTQWTTAFGDAGERVFNRTAEELRQLELEDKDAYDRVINVCSWGEREGGSWRARMRMAASSMCVAGGRGRGGAGGQRCV